jgi:hypothetical protein
MHFTRTLSLLLCSLLFTSVAAFAQTDDDDDDSTSAEGSGTRRRMEMSMNKGNVTPPPMRRWYLGNSFDGAMLSTAIMERPGQRRELTTLRFSMLNFGYHIHYDFDEHFGIFSGLGLKNVGFIEKNGDSTTKRRLYSLGVPLGFKLGNLRRRHFGFIGGGFDIPVNYREKRFVKRNDKYKFNEFWSDRTEDYMPFVFAGFSFGSGTTFKVQYYPSNFFNTDFEEDNNGRTVQPYRGYRVNMLYITLGLDMHYKHHEKKVEEAVEAPDEM